MNQRMKIPEALKGDMIKTILSVLLLFVILSCSTTVKENADQQNSTEMEKKQLGKLSSTYPDEGKKPGLCAKLPMAADGIVRLSKIEVAPEYLEDYMKFAAEVGEVSLRTEPGVLTMYTLSEKENPCKITILETYASKEAYDSHIASEHFQKYKKGTLHMVKALTLSDQIPLNPSNKIINFIQ